MVVSKVRGHFKEFTGSVTTPGKDFSKGNVNFEAAVATINTGAPDRDKHLLTGDFFDSENFPKLTFKSTGITKVSDEEYKMEGDLTIRDITKKITLDVEFGGIVKDPYGLDRAGFHVHGKIDRFDYNLTWNALL
ncbi:MAG: YceI family protein [Bacteroidota bacterium]|nr:YceI family protein [Bacteroidota bacterium]